MHYKGWAVLLFAGVMAALAWAHVDFVNGPSYWKWPWRRLDVAAIVLMAAAAVAYCGVGWWALRCPRSPAIALALLSSLTLAMSFTAATTQASPWGTNRLVRLITSSTATGYLDDAAKMRDGWLEEFPDLARIANPHTATKPAGPVLFYRAMLRWTGGDLRGAALFGAIVLLIVTALGIPATYWAVREITQDAPAALMAAAVLGVMPGFVLMASQFDPAYVALTAVLIAAWTRAMRRRNGLWAVVAGLALAVVLLFAFHLLVIGLFMFLLPIMTRERDAESIAAFAKRFLLLGSTVVAVAVFLHCLLYVLTGYDSLAAFATAYANQSKLAEIFSARRLPLTIGWDLYDYLLGIGWVVLIPLVIAVCRARKNVRGRCAWAICVQLLVIALFGLIPTETARVWLFLTPAVLAPVGSVAASWPVGDRLALVIGTAIGVLSIHGNMIFLEP